MCIGSFLPNPFTSTLSVPSCRQHVSVSHPSDLRARGLRFRITISRQSSLPVTGMLKLLNLSSWCSSKRYSLTGLGRCLLGCLLLSFLFGSQGISYLDFYFKKLLNHLCGGGSCIGVLGDAAHVERLQLRKQAGGPGGAQVAQAHPHHNLRLEHAAVRLLSRDHLPQHDPKRVDVSWLGHGAVQHLGAQVGDGAAHIALDGGLTL
mmetsp:Transcript_21404/g.46867  ORF Transcript_21404/g.46867 Transcript_21404/m.46867 type:complete len:205 (+) Transcript_21404:544-1158(+)